jgi:hypothetical protein
VSDRGNRSGVPSVVSRGRGGGRGGRFGAGEKSHRAADETDEEVAPPSSELSPADDPNNMALFIKFNKGMPAAWRGDPSVLDTALRRVCGPGLVSHKASTAGVTVSFSSKVRTFQRCTYLLFPHAYLLSLLLPCCV